MKPSKPTIWGLHGKWRSKRSIIISAGRDLDSESFVKRSVSNTTDFRVNLVSEVRLRSTSKREPSKEAV
jgi:hypothetical protein